MAKHWISLTGSIQLMDMTHAFRSIRQWWTQDIYRRRLLIFGLLYAWFFGQGIPLWDDDFTSWFWKIKDRSIFQTLLEVISPISTQPQYWGFNERPLQSLTYQLCYLISGYESWSYMLLKSIVYAGLGVMIYSWGRRLAPQTRNGSLAAVAAAVFFLFAPGPMAAHVIHSDLAPTAELFFLMLTYFIWDGVEQTPEEWTSFPSLSNPAQKKWLMRWTILSVLTYIGYKSKADLKLIPGILALYVLAVRRRQWKLFAFPVGFMILLAVPWGGAIFRKLPPFVPGSQGSEIGWMWQPASFERLRDFLWSPGSYSILSAFKDPTLSLAGLLGPFLLVAVLVFLGWKMEAFDKVEWKSRATPSDRARTFALIWFGVILVGISALPAINYIFRIRYGILTMVPASLLLAWVFGLFAAQFEPKAEKLPRWALIAGLACFAVQAGMNLSRSINYRRDMGQVMVSVDQAYEYFAKNHADAKLTLFPDFRPYDYRTDAPKSIIERDWLQNVDDIGKKYQPYQAFAISWKPSLWPHVEMVANFSGCRETSLFDRVFPCPAGSGTYLMRYIGEDPVYKQGEEARSKGDLATARKLHDEFVAKHPQSLAGQFVLGLEAYQLQDWPKAQQAYSMLEKFLPDHLAILYNHALALSQLQQYKPAIDRLRFIAQKEPGNYAALINLYHTLIKDGQEKKARQTLEGMKKTFPDDGEINRLLAATAAK